MQKYRVVYEANGIKAVIDAKHDTTLQANRSSRYFSIRGEIFHAIVRADNEEDAKLKGMEILKQFYML